MTVIVSTETGLASMQPKALSKASVIAAVAGNVLEFYDFTTYTFFAVMIGDHFFPSKDPFISLMSSVATFGVGFITRPIGGMVIGAYGDRAGRKPAMMLTVALMAVGMLIIALTPSYMTIGPLAPVLLVFAQLIQGFALGGEVGPATAFLLEAAPPAKRGLYASWQIASQGLAILIAGAVGLALALTLSTQAMYDWGWRIPFLLGVSIIPVAIFMRRSLPETIDIGAPTAHRSTSSIFSSLFVQNTRPIVLAFLLVSSGTIGNYILTYMTTFAITTLHMPTSVSIAATLVIGVCILVFSLIGGWLSDKFGRRPLLIIPRILFTLAAYPAFLLITGYKDAPTLLIVTGLLTAVGSFGGGVTLAAIPESLPKAVRSAGLATAYAIAVTVFGSTAQPLVTWLIHVTGNPMAPAWYLILASLVGLGASFLMHETKDAALKD